MNTRHAKLEDTDAVLDMYANTELYGGQPDPTRDNAEKIQKLIADGDLLVAEENVVVVGSVQLLANAHSAWLLRFTSPNTAVAEALLEYAKAELKERGHNNVIVYAPSDGPIADRYKELGLTQGHQYSAYFGEI